MERFKKVNALEKKGTRATAIQTGVFEAKPLNMARWGYVGEVTNVNVEPIFMAIDNGCVPVLTCMGQSEDGHFLNINADIAARDVAKVIQPRTVVFVSQKGGNDTFSHSIPFLSLSNIHFHAKDSSMRTEKSFNQSISTTITKIC